MVSKYADLEGPVHFLDFGGDGPPLVCVHGLAGSAMNWVGVAPQLAAHYHVLALDMRGFGRTPLGPGTRLRDNQRLLNMFIREVAGTPATLVANSMGGLVAVRQAASNPETVQSLVLVDPALPYRGARPFDLSMFALGLVMLTPVVGARLMSRRAGRLGAERLIRSALALTCADPGRVPDEVVRAQVEVEIERQMSLRTQRALIQAARSLLSVLFRGVDLKTYGRLKAPVLIIHGQRDRLVPVDISLAIARRFGWTIEVLPEVGHVPMMETPDDFVRITLGWLKAQRPAAA